MTHRLPRLAPAFLAFALAAAPGPVSGSEVPDKLRAELEDVLRAKLGALLKEENADGASHVRATYSREFHEAGDGAYRVTFTKQTAGEEQAATERFLLTLRKDASGKWAITDEQLQERFDGLYRGKMGDEKFFRFEHLVLEREGMKITASGGSLLEDTVAGEPARLVVFADELAYEYAPPRGAAGMYEHVFRHYQKNYPSDVVFSSEWASFSCDPESCRDLLASFSGLEPVSLDGVHDKLRKKYEEDRKDVERHRKEDAFSGFRLLPDPDRRYYNASVKKDGADHYFGLSYDNWDPKEITVRVSRLGATRTFYPILAYYSEQTRNSGADPWELEKRDDPDARHYELKKLTGTIEMGLDDPEALAADVTFTIRTKREVDMIPFRISRIRPIGTKKQEIKDPKMTINSVVLDGSELTVVRTGAASGQILLPKRTAVGDILTIRMQFENRDSIYKLTHSFSYVDRGGWLPFVRFGDMIDEFDLTVKVPSRYKVLGIGKEVSQTVEGDVGVAKFVSPKPVVFPSIVYGNYIEDEPGFKAEKSDGTEIPVRIHVDKASLSLWDIRPKSLKPLAEEAANSLNLYRAVYGIGYPYDKLDLVNDGFGGLYGQAPSSIVYLGSFAFRGRGLMGVIGGGGLAGFNYSLVAHEVAHQWWGSLVANANDGNYWFVESLAEYSAALFLENVYGEKEYFKHVDEWRRNLLSIDLTTGVQDASELSSPDYASYWAAVYNRGPYAFHVLRMTFGDEKFFGFLKSLAGELQGKEIVTRDIQRVAEQSFGGNMEWFFDQWVRGMGIPEYRFEYSARRTEEGDYLVEGVIRQRVVAGTKKDVLEGVYYRGIVPILIAGPKKKRFHVRLLVEGPETPVLFKVPEEPLDVILNPRGEILAHDVVVSRR